MKIVLAKNIGFCFGVRRALDLVTRNLGKTKGPFYTLGPIIHNPQVMKKLEEKKLHCVKSIEKIKRGMVLIRTHGIAKEILEKLKTKKVKVIDATCPYVKRIQNLVKHLTEKNYTIFIFGKAEHPEVEALISYTQGKGKVVQNIPDLTSLKDVQLNKKIGLVCQTTQSYEAFQKIISFFKSLQNREVKIFNTLCPTTKRRQMEAIDLSKKVDVILVIGGKNSSNTTRLAEICLEHQKNTHHIETADEINPQWFMLRSNKRHGKNLRAKVGIVTGASTPDWLIKTVVKRLEKIPSNFKK